VYYIAESARAGYVPELVTSREGRTGKQHLPTCSPASTTSPYDYTIYSRLVDISLFPPNFWREKFGGKLILFFFNKAAPRSQSSCCGALASPIGPRAQPAYQQLSTTHPINFLRSFSWLNRSTGTGSAKPCPKHKQPMILHSTGQPNRSMSSASSFSTSHSTGNYQVAGQ
jgi:hypothetical protein